MPKAAKKKSKGKLLEPWFRASRNAWFICLKGKQVNLGSDEDAARKKFHNLLGAEREQSNGSPQTTVVKIILDKFLDWVHMNRSPETYVSYKKRILSFTEYLQSVGLSAITVEGLKRLHITEWVDSHPNWNPGMRRGMMGAVQRALNWAVDWDIIDRSPIAKLEKPAQGKRETVISEEEYQEILDHNRCQDFEDLVITAWETGCRPQELIRVEAPNTDLKGGRWLFQLTKSKGKKKVRVVNLTERALEITRKRMLKYPTGKLFRNSEGNPWTPWR